MTNNETIPTVPKVVFSTKEAAAYLSISLATLFRLTRAGELAHVRMGRILRYRREDLDSFLTARSTTQWKDFNPTREKTALAVHDFELKRPLNKHYVEVKRLLDELEKENK